MKIKHVFYSILWSFIFYSYNFCADWTILVFVQAKNNLSKFAAQNLSDMASIGSNEKINILVQWYQPNQNGIWRYKINKNQINLDSHIAQNSDGSSCEDLVESMKWAVNGYPAKNYFLILWNHGVGILDPVWNSSHRMHISPYLSVENSKISIDGITKNAETELISHRGILFNELNRTYMNNQELANALKQIKTDVLKNKKLDILGMDACLMAMVEVGYQIRNYAKYMVASQEVELARGWDYLTLLKNLSHGSINPITLAVNIVQTYEHYYQNKIQFYTQSAIDLENIDLVKDGLNQIIKDIEVCKKIDTVKIKKIIKNSRGESIQFSNKNYIDLYSFYSKLNKKLNENYTQAAFNIIKNQQVKEELTKSINNLKESLKLGMKLIENAVIAKTAGTTFSGSQGLSIYFPFSSFIDESYIKTEFAQDSLWVKFIRDIYSK
ncbi:MAG: clostripain-related cysteine peptidase [Candidatus Babeliales bacterium]